MGHPSNRWALNLFSTKTDGPWDRNISTHQYRWILGWGKFSNLWAHKTTLKVSRRTAKDRAFSFSENCWDLKPPLIFMLDPKIKINGRTQGATIENLGFWGYGSILFWLAKNKIDCIAPELRFSMEVPRVAPLILLWPSPVKINGQSCLRNEKSQKSMVVSPRPPSIFNIKLLKNSHVHWFWFAQHPGSIDFGLLDAQGPSILVH